MGGAGHGYSRCTSESKKLFLGGDFNGHVGKGADGYNSAHGGKKEDHLVTFKSGTTKTQINYFLIKAHNRRMCKDCKVIPNEYLGTQHMLLVMDVVIKSLKGTRRSIRDPRVRWWNLTKENATNLSDKVNAELSWRQVKDVHRMW